MNQKKSETQRRSGILVHPTSFPNVYGIGDLGHGAYTFIDFLAASGQTLWQCLPLGPTGYGNSPYQSYSAFAGQPLLISPEKLIQLNLLDPSDLNSMPEWDPLKVDYTKVEIFKNNLFEIAYKNFLSNNNSELQKEFDTFCKEQSHWLSDYTLFMSIKKDQQGKDWTDWSSEYIDPSPSDKKKFLLQFRASIRYYSFIQFIFFRQWKALKTYANKKGIEIIGDIPIFVSPDSADVWAHKELFQLDSKGHPTAIAGVPPDYFSKDGQLWGNPLYNWPIHKKTKYQWWIQRIQHQLELTDWFRIDHFRGFEAYWSVPATEKTAIHGKWIKGPGTDFFDTILRAFDGKLPIIAEDLGIITPEVEELRDHYDFPGMKILQFAFNVLENNNYLPYNYIENCICYTGTHDNNTTKGWYIEADEVLKDKARRYLSCDGNHIHWDFIRLALSSVARFAIFPLQDVLGLDGNSRMNVPGVAIGNWAWRFQEQDLEEWISSYLKQLSELFWRNQSIKEDENK